MLAHFGAAMSGLGTMSLPPLTRPLISLIQLLFEHTASSQITEPSFENALTNT